MRSKLVVVMQGSYALHLIISWSNDGVSPWSNFSSWLSLAISFSHKQFDLALLDYLHTHLPKIESSLHKNVSNPHTKYIIHYHMTVTCWYGMHMRQLLLPHFQSQVSQPRVDLETTIMVVVRFVSFNDELGSWQETVHGLGLLSPFCKSLAIRFWPS